MTMILMAGKSLKQFNNNSCLSLMLAFTFETVNIVIQVLFAWKPSTS